jgi:hypothetical protein
MREDTAVGNVGDCRTCLVLTAGNFHEGSRYWGLM